MDRSSIPYYQVAREALIKWNGLTDEQADKIIEESSFEEIESQVYAQGSMTYAVNAIGKKLGLNDEEIARFADEVFGRKDSTEMMGKLHKELGKANFGEYLSNKQNNMPKLIVDTMEAVHDGWVEDNAKIFLTKKADRGQQYQYLPLELIGWDEAKSDLLFIKPIINAIGGYVDEAEVKEECNRRTIEFFKRYSDRGMDGTLGMSIHNLEDLGNWIAENGLEYDAWDAEIDDKGTSLWNAMQNRELMLGTILPQLREKGFMKDEELMDKLSYVHDPIFEADGPSRDEIIEEALSHEEFVKASDPVMVREELEYLKQKKQALQEEERKISETEKLIEQKENQGPNLDE